MSEALDPYAVLGVSPSATSAEITHAYRRKLRSQHPDTRSTQPATAPVADEQLQRLLAAYTILRDPGRRAAYDRTARSTPRPVRPSPHPAAISESTFPSPTVPHRGPSPHQPHRCGPDQSADTAELLQGRFCPARRQHHPADTHADRLPAIHSQGDSGHRGVLYATGLVHPRRAEVDDPRTAHRRPPHEASSRFRVRGVSNNCRRKHLDVIGSAGESCPRHRLHGKGLSHGGLSRRRGNLARHPR
ncbi:MAG: J domain-containing protein [Candidatus Sericytochromatia bacterium]